jgi:hypothetical protein
MVVSFVTALLLLAQPIADPTYFAYNSPQCVVHRLAQCNPLPIIVRTEHPPCPWTSDEAALVEVGRHLSNYSWWNFERTNNLELASAKIDGTMLLPGEEFSYNETVGERTLDNGYQMSKVIAEYGYTDGVGGGVCQPASNLYAAAFYAGLDITERWTHRFRVKYMPPGLDATIDWGKKDLKVRNNTRFPVVFQMGKVEKGELLARVFSPTRSWRVDYKYEVVKETPSNTVAFELEEQVTDPVHYYGRPGFELKKIVYRKDMRTGKRTKVRVINDEYHPSPWTLRVTEYPTGQRVVSGLSPKKINALLKESKYTVESASFSDLKRLEGEWIRWSYLPRSKQRLFHRFSQLKKFVDLAGVAVPGSLKMP